MLFPNIIMLYFSTYCVVITKSLVHPLHQQLQISATNVLLSFPALGKDTLPSAFNNPLNNPLPLPSVNVFSGFGVVYLEYCLINLILDSLNLLTYLNLSFSHFYSIDLVNLDDLLLVIKYSLYLFRLIESLL